MTQALRLGIAGLGTVGAGVLDILARHKDLVAARRLARQGVALAGSRRPVIASA